MFNFTLTSNNTTEASSASLSNEVIPSLEALLNQLGYKQWETQFNTFILIPINLLGLFLCSFSLWIFSRSSFEDSIFFYYKLLCRFYIIHLIHNIPACLLFSPLYLPMMNTYLTSIYQIYFNTLSFFLLHFEEVLQMAILLQKMKFFSPFIRRNFTARPIIISLCFFFICFLMGIPVGFSFKTTPMGDFFYFDSNGGRLISTLFVNTASNFSQTVFGRLILAFFTFFLHFFLTLLVGVTLNLFSYIKYKSYMNKKKMESYQLQMSSKHNQPTIICEIEQQKQREKKERKVERNMLHMALILCFISIMSGAIFMACYIFFFLNYSFSNSLLLKTLINSLSTFVPAVSTFVFYSFNKMFRDETKIILKRILRI